MSAAVAVRGKTSFSTASWKGFFDPRIKVEDFRQGRCTVLLGGNGKPLLSSGGFISWQAAFVLLSRPNVHVVEYHKNKVVKTASGAEPIPRVMMMTGRWGRHHSAMGLNLHNLMVRDGGRCMYTGNWVTPGHRDLCHQATIDHVVPTGQGGENCWQNVVLASAEANQRKACRTPAEAGMLLINQPWEMTETEFLYLVLHHEAGLYERWGDVLILPNVSKEAVNAFKVFERLQKQRA